MGDGLRIALPTEPRETRVRLNVFARLRFASVRDLAVAAALALVAAIVLDRTTPRGPGDFFVAVLFGLAIGLGVMALGVWQRTRMRG